jgi:hypothetical protein
MPITAVGNPRNKNGYSAWVRMVKGRRGPTMAAKHQTVEALSQPNVSTSPENQDPQKIQWCKLSYSGANSTSFWETPQK